MIGERENKYSETNYGTLVMRPYDIDGNEINAFYDSADDLVFVLDNTINSKKPNILLVINPDGDKKWDEILSHDYDVDLETIRPKQDNKYQKLDIEYSGLNVYEGLINAYIAGDDLGEHLNQLAILRDSAVRHSAMVRLNAANEIISKTNVTIVKTKETIVRLQTRVKTLRAKLTATKKEIGKVPTKQSASKVLKLESQIEATNEKLKRAQKRLESAQKRLEVATVDAELASNLLNQPSTAIKKSTKSKPLMVAPKHELQKMKPDDIAELSDDGDAFEIDEVEDDIDDEDTLDSNDDHVEPLFNQDPKILDEDIAFKPISFEAPTQTPALESNVTNIEQDDVFTPEEKKADEKYPVLESLTPVSDVPEFTPVPHSNVDMVEDEVVERPVLETMTPVVQQNETIVETQEPVLETMKPVEQLEPVAKEPMPVVPDNYKPVAPVAPVTPVAPMTNNTNEIIEQKSDTRKPTFMYYILLIILIVLSVFTLWLYQKNVKNSLPDLAAKVEKTETAEKTSTQKPIETVVKEEADDTETVFLDEVTDEPDVVPDEPDIVPEPQVSVEEEPQLPAPVKQEESAPIVEDVVPAFVGGAGQDEDIENSVMDEDEILASKPVYEPGAKYDEMFVVDDAEQQVYYDDEDVIQNEYDLAYDEEEAAYQAEQEDLDYEE